MNTFQSEGFESSDGGSFLTGMLCGMAIGAAIALFLAPRPGAELRGQVADSVNRAGRRAKETYDRASETVSEIANRAADVAEHVTDRAATMTAKLNRTISARNAPMPS
jgi:gas vesicle protein